MKTLVKCKIFILAGNVDLLGRRAKWILTIELKAAFSYSYACKPGVELRSKKTPGSNSESLRTAWALVPFRKSRANLATCVLR